MITDEQKQNFLNILNKSKNENEIQKYLEDNFPTAKTG